MLITICLDLFIIESSLSQGLGKAIMEILDSPTHVFVGDPLSISSTPESWL